jgi:hypothetical protein
MIAVQVADLNFCAFLTCWRSGKGYQFRGHHNDSDNKGIEAIRRQIAKLEVAKQVERQRAKQGKAGQIGRLV